MSNDSSTAKLLYVHPADAYYRYYDEDVISGVVYYYWVKAVTSVGTSDFSTCDSGYSSIWLSAPSGIQITDGTSTTNILVKWNHVDGATSYQIKRSTKSDIDTAQIIGGTESLHFLTRLLPWGLGIIIGLRRKLLQLREHI